MIELLFKFTLLMSLVLSTCLMGSVVFSGGGLNAFKMILLMPGLLWACWLAGGEVKRTFNEAA